MTTTSSHVPVAGAGEPGSDAPAGLGPVAGVGGADRLLPLSGAAFVASALVGNGLTEPQSEGGTLGYLAARTSSTAAGLGLGLEVVGLALLLVFVAVTGGLLHRRGATTAALTVVVAGTVMAALKLGSGATLLAALQEQDALDEATATALVAANEAAFVLFWVPFGVFLVAAATGLHRAGLCGGGLRWTGVVAGCATGLTGVVAVVEPAAAVPLGFLAGLLWVVAASVRLARARS